MRESKTQALDESNCAVARPGGKEAGVKTASSRTGTCSEAGGGDELAQHNEVPDSLPQVKHGVVPEKFTRLLGETCPAGAAPVGQSAVAGNGGGQRAGVSRGRSSAGNEPRVGRQASAPEPNGPEGLTHARRTEPEGWTVNRVSLSPAIAPYGRAGQWRLASDDSDTARSASFVQSDPWEPPGTDPYAGWYGGRGGQPPRLPDWAPSSSF